jgi:hypothetical protein
MTDDFKTWFAREWPDASKGERHIAWAAFQVGQARGSQSEPVMETEQEMTRRKSFPERIWLSDGNNEGELFTQDSNFEVTWCTDQQDNQDILYVRHDLASSPAHPAEPKPEVIEAMISAYSDVVSERFLSDEPHPKGVFGLTVDAMTAAYKAMISAKEKS